MSCGWQILKLSWQQDLMMMMQLSDRWQGRITLPQPGTGQSEGLWAGCWGPTPWSPTSPGHGCLIHLRQGGRFNLGRWTQYCSALFLLFKGRNRWLNSGSICLWCLKLTLSKLVRDLCLILRAHTDLTLVRQQGLLDRVEHQRVEKTVLDRTHDKRLLSLFQ